MTVVVFPKQYNVGSVLETTPLRPPTTAREFLAMVKTTMPRSEYEMILCALSDEVYFKILSPEMKGIVDKYFTYEEL